MADTTNYAEPNLIKVPDMGAVQAKDFAEQFSESIQLLRDAFGITRDQPMLVGNTIQRYKFVVTPASTTKPGEGVDIPLTHVKRIPLAPIEVGFEKGRKAVSIEEVQRVGYDLAVAKSDKEALNDVHGQIERGFFNYLTQTEENMGEFPNLQRVVSTSIAKMKTSFRSQNVRTIIFLNPFTAADYLSEATINNGEDVGFGLTLLRNFMGGNVDLMLNDLVPYGEFYATVQDNINLMHIDTNGETRKMFVNKPVTTDELGLIALVKDDNTDNLTTQTVYYWGITLFPEVVDGVVKGSLAESTVDPEPTSSNTVDQIKAYLIRHGKTSAQLTGLTKDQLLEVVAGNEPTPTPTPGPEEEEEENPTGQQ